MDTWKNTFARCRLQSLCATSSSAFQEKGVNLALAVCKVEDDSALGRRLLPGPPTFGLELLHDPKTLVAEFGLRDKDIHSA